MHRWMNRAAAAIFAFGTTFSAGTALAQDADPVQTQVILRSGDVVSGALIEQTGEEVIIDHPSLGVVSIPTEDIATLTVGDVARESQAPQEDAAAEEADGEQGGGAEAQAAAPEAKDEDNWKGALEFGLNGSSGNSELVNLRFGARAKRETAETILNLSASYKFAKEDGNETENRFFALAQNDWLAQESPWSWFLRGEFEMDEFTDYDWRLAGFTGPGYRFIDNDTTSLFGRLGVGGAYEESGPRDGFTPQAFAGLDLAHDFNERTRLVAAVEIFPNLEDTGEFRSRENAALEVDLAEAWAFRIGAEHRYDSDPGDADRNDVDYFVTLVYSF